MHHKTNWRSAGGFLQFHKKFFVYPQNYFYHAWTQVKRSIYKNIFCPTLQFTTTERPHKTTSLAHQVISHLFLSSSIEADNISDQISFSGLRPKYNNKFNSPQTQSQGSVANTMTRVQTGESRVQIQIAARFFSSPKCPDMASYSMGKSAHSQG